MAVRVIKVDHAGEHGAVCIHTGQMFMARFTAPSLVAELRDFRSHEMRHVERQVAVLQSSDPSAVAAISLIVADEREHLKVGDCCGIRAGTTVGHQLVNRSQEKVLYLEVGDRAPGDYAEYPRDDLKFTQLETGAWVLTHKDGIPY